MSYIMHCCEATACDASHATIFVHVSAKVLLCGVDGGIAPAGKETNVTPNIGPNLETMLASRFEPTL